MTVDYWLRSDAYADDFTATFTGSSDVIRLWTTATKEEEIILYDYHGSGTEFLLSELPAEVYVEGFERGQATLKLEITGPATALFTNMVVPASGSGAAPTTHSNTVKLTVGLGLTAHRPMHGPNSYDPFPKTRVLEKDEEHAELGPGIRINGDDDNNNSIPDLHANDATVAQENDLIEVRIDRHSGMNDLVLERSSTNLVIWTAPNKGTKVNFPNNGLTSDTLAFTGDSMTVFVEWASMDHGNADLELVDTANNNKVIDTLKFHSFKSVVIAFGGNNQSPTDDNRDGRISDPRDPNVPADLEGVFDLTQKLYESGWDVHPFDQQMIDDGDFSSGGEPLPPPYAEIKGAVELRGVEDVGILGYSYGGGATWELANQLVANPISGTWNLEYSAYIDAVDQGGFESEEQNHYLIDDHKNVKERIENGYGGSEHSTHDGLNDRMAR